MKNLKQVLIVLSVIVLSACMDSYTESYTANVPVYLSYDNLRSAVKTNAPQELTNPGKIYYKDNYLLIVEKFKGFHIIDVSTPSNPKNVSFVEVPGCVDIAIKGRTLYTDSYIDLVAIDLSDIGKVKEVGRVKNIYPYTVPPTGNRLRTGKIEKEKGVVVAWEQKREHNKLEEYIPYPIHYGWREDYAKFSYNSGLTGNVGGSSAASFGKGGSMARFGLYGDYLYTVDQYQMFVFDVSEASNPVQVITQGIGWNVETMFLYDDHMFLGTTNGMIILELKNPSAPKQISSLWHITSCDPVVVQDGYAYLTLRGGTDCRNNTVNRLDVIKLSDDYKINNTIASYAMKEPYGLGIDQNTLFLCDDGLKIFDVTDKLKIPQNLIAHFKDIKTYDVIPLDKFLFTVGDDGFFLYDYSDLKKIRQVASIPVKRKK